VGTDQETATQRAFATSSPALEPGGTLPIRFTCVGAGVSPPFVIDRVPDPTAALAVTAEFDQGAITDATFWTLWNLPPSTERIPAGVARTPTVAALGDARQGRRPDGAVGYEPPCPPPGEAVAHRFRVYALARSLDVPASATHEDVTEAIGNAVLASNELAVTYIREGTPAERSRSNNYTAGSREGQT
jgi:Raf kinase inhibitor-like YbhB/YbcL family protein